MNNSNSEQIAEQRLQQQIDQLPKSLTPARDLWAGIDHAIEQQQINQRYSWQKWSAMAAGFAVLGLTVWLSINVNNDIYNPSGTPAGDDSSHYLVSLSADFEKRKQALLVKYEDQSSATENWREQLQELDDAATAIKKVLDQDPTNAQLIKMLQQTYQQQLDLINAVNKSPWQKI